MPMDMAIDMACGHSYLDQTRQRDITGLPTLIAADGDPNHESRSPEPVEGYAGHSHLMRSSHGM